MSKDITLYTVPVSHWGESKTHWALLVDPSRNNENIITGYMRKEWFSKSICRLERVPGVPGETTYPHAYFLTAPAWLLDEKNVIYNE